MPSKQEAEQLALAFLHSSGVKWLGRCDGSAKTGPADTLEDCGETAHVSAGSAAS